MVIRGINEPARDAPKFHHDLERLAVPQEGVVAFKYFDDLLASIALVPRVYNTGSGFIVDSFDEICLVHAGEVLHLRSNYLSPDAGSNTSLAGVFLECGVELRRAGISLRPRLKVNTGGSNLSQAQLPSTESLQGFGIRRCT